MESRPEEQKGQGKKRNRRNRNKKKKAQAEEQQIDELDQILQESEPKPQEPQQIEVTPQSKYLDNSNLILINDWKEADDYKQTLPPTIPMDLQYQPGQFPVGQLLNYNDNQSWRATSEEAKEKERLLEYDYDGMRKAAECHRQIRRWAQSVLRPGLELHAFTEQLEDYSRQLLQADGLQGGVGFPTGVSIDNVAAHYTPNPGETKILEYDHVCSVDFGTHISGRIIDCAFTVAFNPVYENLLMAPKEATEAGLRAAGIDARLGEIGAEIQETMESFEVELNGKTHKIKVIRNLNGHLIEPYHIHAGKSVPCVAVNDNQRMEEGEVYAIETFGSTGKGSITEDGVSSHFMIDYDMFQKPVQLRDGNARALLRHIEDKYGTLPWSRRQLQRDGKTKHLLPLKNLINANVVASYPPLVDIPGSYVAQFEHTVILRPTCKEIISRGDDY